MGGARPVVASRGMTAWVELAVAFAAFMGTHPLPARPALRRHLTNRLGTRLYLLLYSAISLMLLWWLVAAAGRAPHVPLWEPAAWQMNTTFLAMAAACILLALAVGRPNPFSFGGGDPAHFDPRRPGIVGLTRHPILLAAALWAGAHLLANGDRGACPALRSFSGHGAGGHGGARPSTLGVVSAPTGRGSAGIGVRRCCRGMHRGSPLQRCCSPPCSYATRS